MTNEDPKLVIARTTATDLDSGPDGNVIGYANAVAISAALDSAGFVIVATKWLSELRESIDGARDVLG